MCKLIAALVHEKRMIWALSLCNYAARKALDQNKGKPRLLRSNDHIKNV